MGTPITSPKTPLAGSFAPAGTESIVKPLNLGLPERMDLKSLMTWLTKRMSDSDADIRSKMADMADRKKVQERLGELTDAFRRSMGGVDTGGGYLAVEKPLDNPAAIKNEDWYKALDSETRKRVDGVLDSVHPPAYIVTGSSWESTVTGEKFEKGAGITLEEAARYGVTESGGGLTYVPERMNKEEIDRAMQSLGDIAKNSSSNDEIELIELQSDISARAQLLQMVSNMIASFNDTAKNIAGNIRG